MAVTYGFYNALAHDRRYNAIQMSSIFDGIINDGIFMSIGTCFRVLARSGMIITVGIGRAWFNHTWTLNDSVLPLTVSQSEVLNNRYDAVILEVNADPAVRANSIKIIKGTPSNTTEPAKPVLKNTEYIHQYPLAYIYVKGGSTSIRQADITDMVGKGTAPYVTGIIDTVNVEDMILQWEDQWKKWYSQHTTEFSKEITDWFESIKDMLDGDAATKLASEILKLQKEIEDTKEDVQKEIDTVKEDVQKEIDEKLAKLGTIYKDYITIPEENVKKPLASNYGALITLPPGKYIIIGTCDCGKHNLLMGLNTSWDEHFRPVTLKIEDSSVTSSTILGTDALESTAVMVRIDSHNRFQVQNIVNNLKTNNTYRINVIIGDSKEWYGSIATSIKAIKIA